MVRNFSGKKHEKTNKNGDMNGSYPPVSPSTIQKRGFPATELIFARFSSNPGLIPSKMIETWMESA